MKIGQCENCKGFTPIPDNWAKLMLCGECNYQMSSTTDIYGTKVIAVAMPTLLAEPVKVEFDPKTFDPTKARRNRPKGMA